MKTYNVYPNGTVDFYEDENTSTGDNEGWLSKGQIENLGLLVSIDELNRLYEELNEMRQRWYKMRDLLQAEKEKQ